MSFTYKEELEGLIAEWQAAYEDYKNDAEYWNEEIRRAKKDYDNAISVLNAERNDLRSEIRALYGFLDGLEGANLGAKITPFDFVRERYADDVDDYIEGNYNMPGMKKSSAGKSALKYGGVGIAFGLIGIGTMSAIDVFGSRAKNKKQYEEGLVEFGNQKLAWQNDLYAKEEMADMWKAISDMTDLYRGCIATVKDAIQDTIIPELGLVKAFLYANPVQEAIMYGDNPSEITATEIQVLENTPFDIHYQFVRNVFDYYTIITTFFRQTVLTDIIEDFEITDEEMEDFNFNIDYIRNKTTNLKNLSLISR